MGQAAYSDHVGGQTRHHLSRNKSYAHSLARNKADAHVNGLYRALGQRIAGDWTSASARLGGAPFAPPLHDVGRNPKGRPSGRGHAADQCRATSYHITPVVSHHGFAGVSHDGEHHQGAIEKQRRAEDADGVAFGPGHSHS